MSDPSLTDLKRAFTENQMPELVLALQIFLDAHPVFAELPRQDRDSAAYSAAMHLLLAIRSQSVVGLVR